MGGVAVAVASSLPQSGPGPHSISEDSIQSHAAFKASATLEEYSSSKANLPTAPFPFFSVTARTEPDRL